MHDDIEVLVHISTSATRQNDELFRAIAGAYAEFEPHRIHRDRRAQRNIDVGDAEETQSPASLSRSGKAPAPGTAKSLVPVASKESYGSFPSDVSFSGRHLGEDTAPEGPERPVSRLAQLDRSYASWRKHASTRPSSKQGREESLLSSDCLEDADTGFIEDSQSALEAVQSQLRDTWSMTSEDTSVDESLDEKDAAVKATSSGAGVAAEHPESQSPRMTGEIPWLMSLKDRIQHDADVGSFDNQADLSESIVLSSVARSDDDPSHLDFSGFPIDAFPPPPAISVMSPTALPSQITAHLAAIKANNPSRFKARKTQRNLDSDERGYWCIECAKWPSLAQQGFWLSLQEHVCSGRIGWGTTLHRESSSVHTLGLVRLYCWGDVVEHMWLLMWLCSKGRISNSGTRWIDADGIVVVEMDELGQEVARSAITGS